MTENFQCNGIQMDSISSEVQELKKYYVYELINSLDDEVFYVGKGQGDRAHQHEIDAASENGQETEKSRKIKTINESKGEVIVRVIGRYRTEEEAFAVEATLIHWVYGIENLTNIQNGHGSDSIRENGEHGELPNVDIPEKVRSFDGSYSRKHEEERDKNSIIPFMTDLKNFLEDKKDLQFLDVDSSNSRFTTLNYAFKKIYLRLSTTSSSKKQIWIGLAAKSGKKEDKQHIETIAEHSEFISRNYGEYAFYPEYNKFSNFEEALVGFEFILGKLKKAIKNIND